MRWRCNASLLLALIMAASATPPALAEKDGSRAGWIGAQRFNPPENRDGGGRDGGPRDGGGLRDGGGRDGGFRDGGGSRDGGGRDGGGMRDGGGRDGGGFRDGGNSGRGGDFRRYEAPRSEGNGNRFWGGPYWGYGARFGHPCRWCRSNCGEGGGGDDRCRRCSSRCGW